MQNPPHSARRLIIALFLLAVCPTAARSQCGVQRLVVSDATPSAPFGASITVDGTTMVAGAPFGGPGGRGLAYVFDLRGGRWVETATLQGQGLAADARFGSANAIAGDTLAVGAPARYHALSPPGTVHLFERTPQGWIETQELSAPIPESNNQFGQCLALQGDTLVVGARSTSFPGGGVVHVFERAGSAWGLTAELYGLTPNEDSAFGYSVALDGDRVLVGAPRSDRAHLFERNAAGWVEVATLTASDPLESDIAVDVFGVSVALDGDVAVVGDSEHGSVFAHPPHLDLGAGALYVFERTPSGWVESQELIGGLLPYYYGCRGLGTDIAIEGDLIVAGAPRGSACDSGQAGVLLFERQSSGQWPALDTARAPGIARAGTPYYDPRGRLTDSVGYSVALHGKWLFASAGYASERAGAVYAYDRTLPDALGCCLETGTRYCTPAPASPSGRNARITVKGSRRIDDDCLFLYLDRVPPNASGTFLMGSGNDTIVPPGSAGPLCIAGGTSGVIRLSGVLQGGIMTHELGTQRVPGLASGFLPGSTWHFQAWYRKGPHRGFSDAVSLTFL